MVKRALAVTRLSITQAYLLPCAPDAQVPPATVPIEPVVLNLEKDFEKTVVAPFVATYLRGETPSPCILCNNYVKFHHLVEKAAGIGADRVATGHYARVKHDETLGRRVETAVGPTDEGDGNADGAAATAAQRRDARRQRQDATFAALLGYESNIHF